MTFADIASGTSVFLDANVFAYHFTQDPQFGLAATQLLERIDRQEISGHTSTHLLSEIAHRVMTLGAVTSYTWPMAGIAYRLKSHPAKIQGLSRFRQVIDEILRSTIKVILIAPDLVLKAAVLSQQYGLLSGDALIVATMQSHGFTNLASNDADFDRVSGLTRYAPA